MAKVPGCGAACSARSRQRHGLLRYPGGGMRGMSGDPARAAPWGEPVFGGSPRGGRDSQAPARPVGVPAPPAWRGPESNRTCPWGSRDGRRGAQPLTGGTVGAAVGMLHPAWHGRRVVRPLCGGLDLARWSALGAVQAYTGDVRALPTGQVNLEGDR